MSLRLTLWTLQRKTFLYCQSYSTYYIAEKLSYSSALTAHFFETGAMTTLTKLQNSTVLGQGVPA